MNIFLALGMYCYVTLKKILLYYFKNVYANLIALHGNLETNSLGMMKPITVWFSRFLFPVPHPLLPCPPDVLIFAFPECFMFFVFCFCHAFTHIVPSACFYVILSASSWLLHPLGQEPLFGISWPLLHHCFYYCGHCLVIFLPLHPDTEVPISFTVEFIASSTSGTQ